MCVRVHTCICVSVRECVRAYVCKIGFVYRYKIVSRCCDDMHSKPQIVIKNSAY